MLSVAIKSIKQGVVILNVVLLNVLAPVKVIDYLKNATLIQFLFITDP